jgi:hypothetical protein
LLESAARVRRPSRAAYSRKHDRKLNVVNSTVKELPSAG